MHNRLISGLATIHRWLTPPLNLGTISPILFLGNQKTGSSAIAQLLAARTGLTIATDLTAAWTEELDLATDPVLLAAFIQKNRYHFRRTIVKENSLTLAADGLFDAMPMARAVFTARHPVHNIRSILDRLHWPGEARSLEQLPDLPDSWRQVIDVKAWGINAPDSISALSHRWRLTTDALLRNRKRANVVKYEDFCSDKVAVIDQLADSLELKERHPIDDLLNYAFQPRGNRRDDCIFDVFSNEAITSIEQICSLGMAALGYESVRNDG